MTTNAALCTAWSSLDPCSLYLRFDLSAIKVLTPMTRLLSDWRPTPPKKNWFNMIELYIYMHWKQNWGDGTWFGIVMRKGFNPYPPSTHQWCLKLGSNMIRALLVRCLSRPHGSLIFNKKPGSHWAFPTLWSRKGKITACNEFAWPSSQHFPSFTAKTIQNSQLLHRRLLESLVPKRYYKSWPSSFLPTLFAASNNFSDLRRWFS